MEYNESNFIYLKNSGLGEYYDELVKAEYLCEYFPKVTKIIVRKVMEAFLKNIAEKYEIDSNVAAWKLLNNIKLKSSLSLSEEIYDYIETILVNGYDHASRNNRNKKISKHPIEILEIMHNILCWYINHTEPQIKALINDYNFKAPSTIEYQQKEVDKIKADILLKDNQINKLRQKIIELSIQSKSVRELNKIIIAIKEEKAYLETVQVLLIKKIEIQKSEVVDIEKNYKIYINNFEKLEKKCNENQELIFNKESQLVKAEIQKQELKSLDKELDENDESIIKMEEHLEEELKIIRQTYENLLNLTTYYQDILETIEFSYDKELQKILQIQKNNIKMKISFEDRIFNENITIYTKNIHDTKRKITIFKEILNEKIKREIKYPSFCRGFLRLEGKELRIIYTMITNNIEFGLISKSKDLLSNYSEDKFLESVNKNLEELKNISDDEIKLILYYKLIKLSQSYLGSICNRKQVIKSMDNMVDRAYEILKPKKDFKDRIRKVDSIMSYYLEKTIINLKNANGDLQINEELTDKIYENIALLKQNVENIEKAQIYYDKFNLDNNSEASLKKSIKLQPFIFLSMMIDLGGSDSYRENSNIIFEVAKFIAKKYSSVGYKGELSLKNFSNEYFMIFLFLSSGAVSFNKKQEDELLPLLIILIISIDLVSDNDMDSLANYNAMVDVWEKKQQKYNDIFIEKEDKQSNLEILMKEKQLLEDNFKELSNTYDVLLKKYDNYKEEFKQIIMNSEKRILLPSFMRYDELRSKKEAAENHINESINKFGTLKSMFSPEIWKDQASKIINESNMLEAEKSLIEEAKQKPYFKKEYTVFLDFQEDIQEVYKLISKEKEKLEKKNLSIDNVKIKISEVQRRLNTIKDVYLDIEEGYY